MKNLFPLLLSAVCCWMLFSDCNPFGNSNTNSETKADSTAQAGTIIVGDDTLSDVTKTVPVVEDPATKAGAEGRKGTSPVRMEECCAGTEPIKPCCCDKVVEQYQSALSKQNYTLAIELKSKDPFFKACKTQIPGFEKSILKADSIYLGN
jgi:hypothetical protein